MDFIYSLPPQLATVLLAMLPVTELRFSIPFALEVLNLSVFEAFIWSIIGDIIPAFLIIYFIGPISKFLRKHWKAADRFFDWLFSRTRRKFSKSYTAWGKFALMIFVAIPLPGTGVWSGSIAAWLFDLSKKESLCYIIMGAILSGVLVTAISLGFFKIFNF
jgi:uncharacterized membrane protein